MNPIQRLLAGLELPEDASFREAMLPELQRQMTDLDAAAWAELAALLPQKDAAWQTRLVQVLSPTRHGKPSTAMLFKLATDGDSALLEAICEKLLAAQVLNAVEKAHLATRLMAIPLESLGHHGKMRISELIQDLEAPTLGPSIQEASEFSMDHRQQLAQSQLAACYYCQTVFEAASISEYTDGGGTALCPFCGIDAVLPSAAGYVFSPANLEALNAFWFQ